MRLLLILLVPLLLVLAVAVENGWDISSSASSSGPPAGLTENPALWPSDQAQISVNDHVAYMILAPGDATSAPAAAGERVFIELYDRNGNEHFNTPLTIDTTGKSWSTGLIGMHIGEQRRVRFVTEGNYHFYDVTFVKR